MTFNGSLSRVPVVARLVVFAAFALALVACSAGTPASAALTAHQGSAKVVSRVSIPASWTAQANRAYNTKVKGKNAYEYLTYRAAHRKKNERLVVTLGVDHVASYDGPRVDATYKFYEIALKYGYEVHFITGSGIPRAKRLLAGAGFTKYTSLTQCPGTNGEDAMARCKGNVRTRLAKSGRTLVVNVGAHTPAWQYGAQAERTIKIRY